MTTNSPSFERLMSTSTIGPMAIEPCTAAIEFRDRRLAGLHTAGAVRAIMTWSRHCWHAQNGRDLHGAGFAAKAWPEEAAQRGGKQKAQPDGPHRESLLAGSKPDSDARDI